MRRPRGRRSRLRYGRYPSRYGRGSMFAARRRQNTSSVSSVNPEGAFSPPRGVPAAEGQSDNPSPSEFLEQNQSINEDSDLSRALKRGRASRKGGRSIGGSFFGVGRGSSKRARRVPGHWSTRFNRDSTPSPQYHRFKFHARDFLSPIVGAQWCQVEKVSYRSSNTSFRSISASSKSDIVRSPLHHSTPKRSGASSIMMAHSDLSPLLSCSSTPSSSWMSDLLVRSDRMLDESGNHIDSVIDDIFATRPSELDNKEPTDKCVESVCSKLESLPPQQHLGDYDIAKTKDGTGVRTADFQCSSSLHSAKSKTNGSLSHVEKGHTKSECDTECDISGKLQTNERQLENTEPFVSLGKRLDCEIVNQSNQSNITLQSDMISKQHPQILFTKNIEQDKCGSHIDSESKTFTDGAIFKSLSCKRDSEKSASLLQSAKSNEEVNTKPSIATRNGSGVKTVCENKGVSIKSPEGSPHTEAQYKTAVSYEEKKKRILKCFDEKFTSELEKPSESLSFPPRYVRQLSRTSKETTTPLVLSNDAKRQHCGTKRIAEKKTDHSEISPFKRSNALIDQLWDSELSKYRVRDQRDVPHSSSKAGPQTASSVYCTPFEHNVSLNGDTRLVTTLSSSEDIVNTGPSSAMPLHVASTIETQADHETSNHLLQTCGQATPAIQSHEYDHLLESELAGFQKSWSWRTARDGGAHIQINWHPKIDQKARFKQHRQDASSASSFTTAHGPESIYNVHEKRKFDKDRSSCVFTHLPTGSIPSTVADASSVASKPCVTDLTYTQDPQHKDKMRLSYTGTALKGTNPITNHEDIDRLKPNQNTLDRWCTKFETNTMVEASSYKSFDPKTCRKIESMGTECHKLRTSVDPQMNNGQSKQVKEDNLCSSDRQNVKKKLREPLNIKSTQPSISEKYYSTSPESTPESMYSVASRHLTNVTKALALPCPTPTNWFSSKPTCTQSSLQDEDRKSCGTTGAIPVSLNARQECSSQNTYTISDMTTGTHVSNEVPINTSQTRDYEWHIPIIHKDEMSSSDKSSERNNFESAVVSFSYKDAESVSKKLVVNKETDQSVRISQPDIKTIIACRVGNDATSEHSQSTPSSNFKTASTWSEQGVKASIQSPKTEHDNVQRNILHQVDQASKTHLHPSRIMSPLFDGKYMYLLQSPIHAQKKLIQRRAITQRTRHRQCTERRALVSMEHQKLNDDSKSSQSWKTLSNTVSTLSSGNDNFQGSLGQSPDHCSIQAPNLFHSVLQSETALGESRPGSGKRLVKSQRCGLIKKHQYYKGVDEDGSVSNGGIANFTSVPNFNAQETCLIKPDDYVCFKSVGKACKHTESLNVGFPKVEPSFQDAANGRRITGDDVDIPDCDNFELCLENRMRTHHYLQEQIHHRERSSPTQTLMMSPLSSEHPGSSSESYGSYNKVSYNMSIQWGAPSGPSFRSTQETEFVSLDSSKQKTPKSSGYKNKSPHSVELLPIASPMHEPCLLKAIGTKSPDSPSTSSRVRTDSPTHEPSTLGEIPSITDDPRLPDFCYGPLKSYHGSVTSGNVETHASYFRNLTQNKSAHTSSIDAQASEMSLADVGHDTHTKTTGESSCLQHSQDVSMSTMKYVLEDVDVQSCAASEHEQSPRQTTPTEYGVTGLPGLMYSSTPCSSVNGSHEMSTTDAYSSDILSESGLTTVTECSSRFQSTSMLLSETEFCDDVRNTFAISTSHTCLTSPVSPMVERQARNCRATSILRTLTLWSPNPPDSVDSFVVREEETFVESSPQSPTLLAEPGTSVEGDSPTPNVHTQRRRHRRNTQGHQSPHEGRHVAQSDYGQNCSRSVFHGSYSIDRLSGMVYRTCENTFQHRQSTTFSTVQNEDGSGTEEVHHAILSRSIETPEQSHSQINRSECTNEQIFHTSTLTGEDPLSLSGSRKERAKGPFSESVRNNQEIWLNEEHSSQTGSRNYQEIWLNKEHGSQAVCRNKFRRYYQSQCNERKSGITGSLVSTLKDKGTGFWSDGSSSFSVVVRSQRIQHLLCCNIKKRKLWKRRQKCKNIYVVKMFCSY